MITWKAIHPGAQFTAHVGVDENGNQYYTPANRETVTVTTPDGRSAMGWTEREALARALSLPVPADEENQQEGLTVTERKWYLVADGEAHPLDHDQAVLLQTAADDNDEADELYRNLTGGQRYDGACGRDYVVTLAENDDDALLLSILYDHDEAALDNVACPDCGQTHITLYAATEDKSVQRAAAELMTAADHVADADGGCQCDFCRGGLNTIQQIAGFFPAGWWGETPEQREQAIEIARRAVGGA